MRANSPRILGLVVGALAWGNVAAVTGSTRQQFPIPGHGSLLLDVPVDWSAASVPLSQPPSITLTIRPATGDALLLKMTTVWMDAAAGQSLTRDRIQEGVRQAAKAALSQAAEKEAPLMDLKGKDTFGYFFSVTDKHSSNIGGDYKYMSQGTAATGPALTAFTLLSRSPDPAERDRALRVVASATWSAQPTGGANAEPNSLQVEESNENYRLSVPVSRLVMIIPRSGLKKASTAFNASPRYFHFNDESRSFVVSGWFESGADFPGVKKFWDDETRTWSKRGLPNPHEVTFTKVGGWDAILYDIPIPDATNSHLRAHWVAAGTWIDVHLSTTGTGTRADSRAALLRELKTFHIEEKN